jgi:hypothetical protein
MKDTSAPAALMVFLMAIVALVLLNDLTAAPVEDQTDALVEEALSPSAENDLATSDDFE